MSDLVNSYVPQVVNSQKHNILNNPKTSKKHREAAIFFWHFFDSPLLNCNPERGISVRNQVTEVRERWHDFQFRMPLHQMKLDGKFPPCCPKERNKGGILHNGRFLVKISTVFLIV